ncbi:hypothetical protein QWY86_09200 [Pedobacter aquatilis]|uniref:hypothetical protein n=1 Tax=Pedobacter aquatilis TaxID=351343 RepID=UPI0025B59127|nr:hypothetical protein [Pedobacter aquatilis]MDN3586842.1 hypothetical protein [Pedobacter aquatilis]
MAENGKISYNNKPISNLYIDGDNLLDDKYNIGTKSIEHKIVTNIQVIDRDQPIKMLQKNNLSTDVAINLVLDKTVILKVMGNAKIGAGLPDKYDSNIDVMMFRPEIKFLNNFSGNNIGIDISDDVVSHNKGNSGGNDKLPNQLSSGVAQVPYLQKNRYLLNNSGILNTNYLYKFSADKQIKTNIYYFFDSRRQQNSYFSSYFLPSDTISYTEHQYNKVRNQNLYALVNYIDNSANHYINDKLTFEYFPQRNKAAIQGVEMPFQQLLLQKSFNFSNELKYLQNLKSGNILNLNSIIQYTTQDEELNLNPGLNAKSLNQGVAYKLLNQQVNTPSLYTNNYISYSRNSNHFVYSLQSGFSFQHIDFNSNLFKTLNNNQRQPITNGFNQFNWNKLKLYLTPQLDYKTESILLTLYAPISFNHVSYGRNYQRLFINPSVNFRYIINQENKLNASYSFSQNMGKVDNIFDGYILKSYRSLYTNINELPFYKTNAATLGFRHQKAVSLFFANGQLSYTNTIYNNITQSVVNDVATVLNTLLLPNSVNQLNISASIGKYLTSLNTNLAIDINMGNTTGLQLQNAESFRYQNRTYSAGITDNSAITKNISLDYRGFYTLAVNNLAQSHKLKLNQIRQNISVSMKLVKDIRLNYNINHYFIHQTGRPNLNYFFNDVLLKYSFLKIKTDFELGVNNIANIKKFNSYYINLNNYISSEYEIQGRFLMLRAIFAIN